MHNPEKLTRLGTQGTGRKQREQTTQCRKLER
jgi:hypothetical protein